MLGEADRYGVPAPGCFSINDTTGEADLGATASAALGRFIWSENAQDSTQPFRAGVRRSHHSPSATCMVKASQNASPKVVASGSVRSSVPPLRLITMGVKMMRGRAALAEQLASRAREDPAELARLDAGAVEHRDLEVVDGDHPVAGLPRSSEWPSAATASRSAPSSEAPSA